jgi:DNA replication protein DnaC
MRAARRYLLPDEQRWLVLLGGAGSGKTLAAAWVLGEWLAAHAQWTAPSGAQVADIGLFANAGEFSGMADFNANDRAWFERLAKCGLLVLDDLGAERLGEMELGMVQRLLMSRHAKGLRTVITSNLDAAKLAERYGDRVVDRMREVARVVDAGSVSLRKKPASRRKEPTP